MNKYPYPIAMTLNAVTVFIAWILIVAFFAILFLGLFDINFDLSTNHQTKSVMHIGHIQYNSDCHIL